MGINDKDLEICFRQWAVAERAGLPIQRFIDDDHAKILGPKANAALKSAIRQKGSVKEAFSRTGLLDQASLAFLHAGEVSGNLAESFELLAELAAHRRKSTRALLAALFYPVGLLFFASFVLPLPIIFSVGLGAYLTRALPPAVVILVVASFLWIVWPRLGPENRLKSALMTGLNATPILSGVMNRRRLAVFFDVLGKTLHAGLAVSVAVELACDASGYEKKKMLRNLSRGLEQAIASGMKIDAKVSSMLKTAEQTGNLPGTLALLAKEERAGHQRGMTAFFAFLGVTVFLLVAATLVAGILEGAKGYMNAIDQATEVD